MKKTILILMTLFGSTMAMAENPLHYNMVSFRESASQTVPNDTMHLQLLIQVEHKNRETAAQMTTRQLNAVQDKIKQNQQFMMELGSRTVYPKYDDKQKIIAWQDSATIYVKSKQFNQLSQLISDVQAHAMPRGTWFSLSPEKRQQAVEQTSRQALKLLRQRANDISQQLGFSTYQFVKLDINNRFETSGEASISERRMPVAPMAAMAKSADYAPAVEMEPQSAGEQTIYQNVDVVVQMK